MSKDKVEVVAGFNPASWKPNKAIDSGEELFSEADAIEAAVRMLNAKGINIRSIWHAYDSAIEIYGKRAYISLAISDSSAEQALMEAMREISNVINAQDDIECYISQQRGEYSLHIRSTATQEE